MVMMFWNIEEQVARFVDGYASIAQLIQWCPENEVDELVEYMKSEADRYRNIRPQVAFKLAEGIIALGCHHKNSSHVALGLMARGDARKDEGEFQAAWDDFEEAGKLFKSLNDELGWARTRIGLVWVCVDLQQVEKGLTDAKRAEEIFLARNAIVWLINLYMNIGTVYQWLADFQTALRHFNAALRYALQMGAHGERFLGRLYLNLGSSFDRLGEFRQARVYFETARSLFIERGETNWMAYVEGNLGAIEHTTGHYRRALQYLYSAQAHAQAQNAFQLAQIKDQIVLCYIELNRYEEACRLVFEVVEQYDAIEAHFGKALANFNLATILAYQMDFDAAGQVLDETLTTFEQIGSEAWLARVKIFRGAIALKQGNAQLADSLVSSAIEALGEKSSNWILAQALLLRGQALQYQGRPDEALIVTHKAMQLAHQTLLTGSLYTAHLLLGRLHVLKAENQTAQCHFEIAISTVENVQRGLTITLRPDFLQNKQEALHELMRLHLREGRAADAVYTLERVKSQVFFDYLTSQDSLRWVSDNPRMQPMLEELEQLREDHQWYRHLLTNTSLDDRPPEENADQIQKQIARCEARMRLLTEQLYLYAKDNDHKASHLDLPSLSDIQKRLQHDERLLQFYNDGHQLWLFVISNEHILMERLPANISQIEKWLAHLRFNVDNALKAGIDMPVTKMLSRDASTLGNKIYEQLLASIAETLKDVKRLFIVPYGSLHYLPFNLLHDSMSYLIERYELVLLPAAGLITQDVQPRPRRALVLAHSLNGYLTETSAEAALVHDIFGGEIMQDDDARRAVLHTEPCQILHIAAHGEFRIDRPDLSFIQLADGPLYTDDLLQRDMSYELVTLGACETGRASVAAGDELIGLGRGCLYAGAGALLVSQWRTEDRMTYTLMQSIYRSLISGSSKAAALQKAQKKLLADDPTLHPAFWGAFQLIGNAAPLST
ncbi:MAG: CHAT domain-containing protein [Chloroflexi bacterium]|nr:CHAT domain-containing protein [Chloroflexota bacterium]